MNSHELLTYPETLQLQWLSLLLWFEWARPKIELHLGCHSFVPCCDVRSSLSAFPAVWRFLANYVAGSTGIVPLYSRVKWSALPGAIQWINECLFFLKGNPKKKILEPLRDWFLICRCSAHIYRRQRLLKPQEMQRLLLRLFYPYFNLLLGCFRFNLTHCWWIES